MGDAWLIVNSGSGSYDTARVEAVTAALAEAGHAVSRRIALPDDDLPSAAEATKGAPALIAIYTGDGTVSAAVDSLWGWDGPLLVLPGGTMNLLSGKLHGEAPAEEIVVRSDPARTVRMTMAEGCGQRSLVGIIAGPTTAWGDVREDLRNVDIAGLTQSVPQALDQTLKGELMAVEGHEGEYQAIFVEPGDGILEATGIKAANIADLAQHGFAWLTRDFLGGPSEPLLRAKSVTVLGSGAVGLLVDGERAEASAPCTFTARPCPLNFMRTP